MYRAHGMTQEAAAICARPTASGPGAMLSSG